jgi:signal transduction histidine kinase
VLRALRHQPALAGKRSDVRFHLRSPRLFSIAQKLIDNALKHAHGGDIVIGCTRRKAN